MRAIYVQKETTIRVVYFEFPICPLIGFFRDFFGKNTLVQSLINRLRLLYLANNFVRSLNFYDNNKK